MSEQGGKGEKERQGPTSMEHTPFICHHITLGTLDLSHIISPNLGEVGIILFAFCTWETEVKDMKEFCLR